MKFLNQLNTQIYHKISIAKTYLCCSNACDFKHRAAFELPVMEANLSSPEIIDLLDWPLHQPLSTCVQPHLPRKSLKPKTKQFIKNLLTIIISINH